MTSKPPVSPLGDPKDTRNLFAAIILSLAVVGGWQYYVEGPKQAAIRAEQAQQQLQAVTSNPDPTQAPVLPEVTSATPTAVPDAPVARADVLAQGARIKISNDNVHGSISLTGLRLDDLTLARYRETVDPTSPEIVLLSPAGTAQPYYAEQGWRAAEGVVVPDANTVWKADKTELTAGSSVTLSWNNGHGLTFERIISLDDKYMFTIEQKVTNNGSAAVELHPYGLVARNADPAHKSIYISHEGPIAIFNNKLVEHDYKQIAEQKIVKEDSTGGWLGFTDKYWLVALIPDQQAAISTRTLNVPQVSDHRFQMDYMAPVVTVAPGQSQSVSAHVFAGAKEVRVLDSYAEKLGVPHFDLAIDFGWYYFLTKPFFYALDMLAGIFGSFALAILAFTVVLKAVMFIPAEHSYVSMAKMKKLTPKLTELRETYASDPARQSQEMMAMYKKEGINPLSGCWPILIQIPIFFSLYKVLYVSIEMRHAPFYGWIKDLSAADPSNLLTLFGYLQQPILGAHIGLLPILMGLTMWLQMKMNPPPTDPSQRMIFGMMPIIFTISMSSFAVGLVIYWTWSNILSIAQQYLIMHRMKVRVFD